MFQEYNTSCMFVFKGKYYWKKMSNDMPFDMKYPKPVEHFFPGIIGDINGIVQLEDNSYLVFQGDKVYKYTKNRTISKGFPMKIDKVFKNFPRKVDTVFQYDEITYALKGNQFWEKPKSQEKKAKGENKFVGPLPIESKWKGLPPNVDAVIVVNNGIYFFKGDSFYRFHREGNSTHFELTPGKPDYPRKTAIWWFGCEGDTTSLADDNQPDLEGVDVPLQRSRDPVNDPIENKSEEPTYSVVTYSKVTDDDLMKTTASNSDDDDDDDDEELSLDEHDSDDD